MSGFVEAGQAGISSTPVDTSTKKAMRRWKKYQSEIAELVELQEWDRAGHNIAVICGEVSGRLLCIDIEGSFVDADQLPVLARRLREAGCYSVFAAWRDGYCESTPSGGLHLLVRVEGEGALDGNTKLAVDADGKVLIETRAEGGYVIVAPSRNGERGWDLISGGFATIAYCTWDEWVKVQAVLESFDNTPAPPATLTVDTRSTVPLPAILRLDDSWIEPVKAALPPIRLLLEQHGWIFPGSSDQFGEHCVRPGKQPRDGHSANLSHDGYLWVHSTNANLPTGVGLDAADLLICWATPHSAAPSKDERTEFFKAQHPPAVRDARTADTGPVAALNLSTDFWTARPYLAHIHQAALSQRLSPDAVWAGVKCFYAATIPWNHRLPGDGTFDYIAIVVGASGAGKSRAKHCAWRLLENLHNIDGIRFPVPVGSGEGMTEIYLDRTDSDRRYKLRGVGFYADEGKFLLDIASRSGNTTMQAVKQMWSGELTGTVAATTERHRWLDPRDVRATLLISTTPDIATQFMSNDYTDEGLPQRIAWAWATYPHPDTAPNWPGPLDTHLWNHNQTLDNTYTIDLHPDIAADIDTRQLAAARGELAGDDTYEGHATYATLKCAGIHAHLDGRLNITPQDWDLARHDWQTTRQIRQHLHTHAQAHAQDTNIAVGHAQAHKRIAENDVLLEKTVQSLIRKLHTEKTLTNRQIRDHLRSYWKKYRIDPDEAVTITITRGLAERTDGGIRSV